MQGLTFTDKVFHVNSVHVIFTSFLTNPREPSDWFLTASATRFVYRSLACTEASETPCVGLEPTSRFLSTDRLAICSNTIMGTWHKSGNRESNPQQSVYKTYLLPLNYSPLSRSSRLAFMFIVPCLTLILLINHPRPPSSHSITSSEYPKTSRILQSLNFSLSPLN